MVHGALAGLQALRMIVPGCLLFLLGIGVTCMGVLLFGALIVCL
jgi:hypothetical protein